MDYNWDLERDIVQGFVSNQEEIRQWIQRMLLTERNMFPQYSDQYGIEFHALRGQKPQFMAVHMKKSIEDAILVREDIRSVGNFEFHVQRDQLHLSFTVYTIYGTFDQQVEIPL